MPKAIAQFTIRDETDITVGAMAPINPILNQLWLDTGLKPSQLKKWSGSVWEIVNEVEASSRNLLRYTNFNDPLTIPNWKPWASSKLTYVESEKALKVSSTVVTNIGAFTLEPTMPLEIDKEYTISLRVKPLSPLTQLDYIYVMSNEAGVTNNLIPTILIQDTLNWSRVNLTFKCPKNFNKGSLMIGAKITSVENGEAGFMFKELIMVKGNKVPDWSIATEDLIDITNSQRTDFTVSQGQIETLIKDTTIITSEGNVKLKDAYSSTNQTVNGLSSKVGNIETEQRSNRKVASFRYVRDWLNGSSANTGNHWCELEVWVGTTNIALGKVPTGSMTLSTPGTLTDGNTSHTPYVSGTTGWQWVQVDLGIDRKDVDMVRVFHYWADARQYNHKLQVSRDGVTWIDLYNSDISGTYIETDKGRAYVISESYIESRITTTEQNQTATAIVNTINESINKGETSINTVTTTLDKTGFTIKNGAIKILNKANVEVLLSDVNGDLTMRGKFEQYNLSTGIKSVEIINNQVRFFDFERNGDFLGSVYGGVVPGKNYGALAVYGDIGNPLYIGSGKVTGLIVNDNLEQPTPLYIATECGTKNDFKMLNYSNFKMFGNDYNIPLLELGFSNNHAYILSCRQLNKNVMLGGYSGDSYYAYFQADSGGCTAYGNLACTGSKMRAVNTEFGVVGQNAYETASPMFGDIGEGRIGDDGLCYVFIDPIMLATINTKYSYQVFLQKYGEGDVYPVERNENYFLVKGTKGIKFAWELKAHQKGFENDRLEILDPLVQTDYTSGMEVLEDEINYEENANEYLSNYEKELFIYG